MLYLALLPVVILAIIIWSFVMLRKRIDSIEEKITTDYAPIISDLHRRLEVLETEEKLKN